MVLYMSYWDGYFRMCLDIEAINDNCGDRRGKGNGEALTMTQAKRILKMIIDLGTMKDQLTTAEAIHDNKMLYRAWIKLGGVEYDG